MRRMKWQCRRSGHSFLEKRSFRLFFDLGSVYSSRQTSFFLSMTVAYSVAYSDSQNPTLYVVSPWWNRLGSLAHGELAWLFHEPDTGLDDCLNMLLSCFKKGCLLSVCRWRRQNFPVQIRKGAAARLVWLDRSLGTTNCKCSLRSQFNARHLFNSWITRATPLSKAEIPQRQSTIDRTTYRVILVTKILEPSPWCVCS